MEGEERTKREMETGWRVNEEEREKRGGERETKRERWRKRAREKRKKHERWKERKGGRGRERWRKRMREITTDAVKV